MNELQKEYFERLAREEEEREAEEEARLKAFMEEERKKDADRKAQEDAERAAREAARKKAREEEERKAEEEAAEIINRMKAKIQEERFRDKRTEAQREAQKEEKKKRVEVAIEGIDSRKKIHVAQPGEEVESDGYEFSGVTGDASQRMDGASPDMKEEMRRKEDGGVIQNQTVLDNDQIKEVIKPSDGTKKSTSPKFKKGGKKGGFKIQTSTPARPKPIEPDVPKQVEEPVEDIQETAAEQDDLEAIKAAQSVQEELETAETRAANEEEQENPDITATEIPEEEAEVEEEPEVIVENTEFEEDTAEEASETDGDEKDSAAEDETEEEEKLSAVDSVVVQQLKQELNAAAAREARWKDAAYDAQDRYKRLLAEFENARTREAKEGAQKFDQGVKHAIEKLLPIVDNFERAVQTIPEEDRDRAFEQGVDKIYKQMMKILNDMGVEPMNAVGTEFNQDLHNAVIHIEDDSYGENIIVEEMQKGYMYKDSVLRFSMVKVAN